MSEPVPPALYTREYYLAACGGSEFFSRYGPKVLKPALQYPLLRAELRPGLAVLDVGCGRGELLYHARQAGAFAVGTDYSAAALAIAGPASGCPVLLADAKALPFGAASFDRIFFLGLIDHLHGWELEAAFRELGRVLKPGGFVIAHTCTNRLYYKNWTYPARLAAARLLGGLGLGVGEPAPPRSVEDRALHVNEQTIGSLRRFFRRIGWSASVEPRPNYKLVLRELYGEPLPEGFPLRPASELKRRLYKALLWRTPLTWVLAHELFCVAAPMAGAAAGRGAAAAR